MFLVGNFQHTLDDKNRIRLPAKYREVDQLGNNYILMPGQNGCIFVYSAKEGQKFIQALRDLETFDPDRAECLRSLSEYSALVQADSQGRFIIPDDLLEICGINKEVHIVGAISKVEIWSEERYQERRKKQDHTPKGFDELYRNLHKAMDKQ